MGTSSQLEKIATSKYWLKLLHYKKPFLFGKMRSQVDGPDFFFSRDGHIDPKAELVATIEAFSKDIKVGRLKQHPQCAFPERYRYLKAELSLKTTDVWCEKLTEFLAKFNAKSATLVFSSAYPNNPGSMFGHTFLRINSAVDASKKLDLLDHGLSYAAVVPPEHGGLEFAARGLTGGYLGQFSMMPYYAKVNEYVNSESRDIWEYDLNISPEETHRLLLHVWEIETNSWFDYYFFDENCAYHLLALLEVAKPEWEGITDWGIYVIPGETAKRLAAVPGAVRFVKFRPSLRKKMLQKYAALSSAERTLFGDLTNGRIAPEQVDDGAVLETAAAYLYYVKQRDDGKLSDAHANLLRASLTRRSELGPDAGFKVELPPITEDTRPDLGHNTYRVGASGGMGKGLAFQELHFKFAFHDLLNKDVGYIRYSQIDFPGVTLRYLPKPGKLNLEQINGLAITSLFPMTFIEKRLSWRAATDYYSPKDFGCLTCHVVRGEAGVGATFELFKPEYAFAALGLANLELGEPLRKGYRIGPKLRSMFLLNPFENYKTQFLYEFVSDLGQSDRPLAFHQFEWNQSYSMSREWELRVGLMRMGQYNEGKLSANYYF